MVYEVELGNKTIGFDLVEENSEEHGSTLLVASKVGFRTFLIIRILNTSHCIVCVCY